MAALNIRNVDDALHRTRWQDWSNGRLLPAWRARPVGCGLAERSVRRIPMTDGVLGQQVILFKELGERIRDIRSGPDGAVYLLIDSPNGRVLRVVP